MIPDGEGSLDVGEHQMMLTMDPPKHTGFRKLVATDFIPRAAKAMRPRIEKLASRIIDGVIDRGECDLVNDIAGLMPSFVIADMLGIPHEDGVALYQLTETIHAAPESVPAGAALGAVSRCSTTPAACGSRSGPSRPTILPRSSRSRRSTSRARPHRLQLVLPVAHRRRRRHDAQSRGRRHRRAVRSSRATRVVVRRSRRTNGLVGRGAPSVGEPGRLHAPHRDARYRARRRGHRRRRQGGHVLRLGQPRPWCLRSDGRRAQPCALTERPCGLRRRRTSLLSRRPHRASRFTPCCASC